MNNKKFLLILIVGLITISLPTKVFAKTINSLNLSKDSNKITVTGTAENGTLAVAVVVYKDSTLNYMQSCNVEADNTYSCELNHTFAKGDYEVKVADYDGGAYITKSISIDTDNPKTFDNIITYAVLGIISIIGIFVAILNMKKTNKIK